RLLGGLRAIAIGEIVERGMHFAAVEERWAAAQPMVVLETAGKPIGIGHSRAREKSPVAGFFGDQAEIVHLNGAIRALLGAEATADAPVFDHYLLVVAAVNGTDRTADHANRIEAGPAGRRHEVLAEARAVEKEPAAAVFVRVHAAADAFVA